MPVTMEQVLALLTREEPNYARVAQLGHEAGVRKLAPRAAPNAGAHATPTLRARLEQMIQAEPEPALRATTRDVLERIRPPDR